MPYTLRSEYAGDKGESQGALDSSLLTFTLYLQGDGGHRVGGISINFWQ